MSSQDKNPFIVPRDYFDKLSDDIKGRIDEELVNGDILRDGFMVPDDYFESLESSVMRRSVASGARIIKWRWITGIAASFLLVAALWVNNNQSSETPFTLSEEDSFYWLEDNLADLEEDELLELYVDEIGDLDEAEIDYGLDSLLDDFTQEELENIF